MLLVVLSDPRVEWLVLPLRCIPLPCIADGLVQWATAQTRGHGILTVDGHHALHVRHSVFRYPQGHGRPVGDLLSVQKWLTHPGKVRVATTHGATGRKHGFHG